MRILLNFRPGVSQIGVVVDENTVQGRYVVDKPGNLETGWWKWLNFPHCDFTHDLVEGDRGHDEASALLAYESMSNGGISLPLLERLKEIVL